LDEEARSRAVEAKLWLRFDNTPRYSPLPGEALRFLQSVRNLTEVSVEIHPKSNCSAVSNLMISTREIGLPRAGTPSRNREPRCTDHVVVGADRLRSAFEAMVWTSSRRRLA
jgi:hypothetical protein